MKKKILVIIGARGIGDLIYHLPLLRSLHLTHKQSHDATMELKTSYL